MSDIKHRYFKSGKSVKNALAGDSREKFKALIAHFGNYGKRFTIDPFLLTAQGYQEIRLNQSMRDK